MADPPVQKVNFSDVHRPTSNNLQIDRGNFYRVRSGHGSTSLIAISPAKQQNSNRASE
jgi:hypothetical protein